MGFISPSGESAVVEGVEGWAGCSEGLDEGGGWIEMNWVEQKDSNPSPLTPQHKADSIRFVFRRADRSYLSVCLSVCLCCDSPLTVR